MIWFDFPYGLSRRKNHEPWDVRWSDKDVEGLFKSIELVTQGRGCCFYFWAPLEQLVAMKGIASKCGWAQLEYVTWTKPYHAAYAFNCLNPVTEHALFGIKVVEGKVWQSPLTTRNLHRPNSYVYPAVTTFYPDLTGKPCNSCEKPVGLTYKLMCTMGTKGQNVLVLGAGSGAEVLAALAAGFGVIAVEQDTLSIKLVSAGLNNS